MKIDSNSQIQFKARCPEIKAGKDVCHIIRTQFPAYSLSRLNKRIDTMLNAGKLDGVKYQKTLDWWERKKTTKGEGMDYVYFYTNHKFYEALIRFIKKTKIADCGQYADLSRFILKLNGYNASTATIKTAGQKGFELDHEICVFNKDNSPVKEISKKTIILDAWLGECDFAPKILKKYKEQYNGYFKEHGLIGPSEQFIIFKPRDEIVAIPCDCDRKIRNSAIRKLREEYPALLIRGTKYKPVQKQTFMDFINRLFQ